VHRVLRTPGPAELISPDGSELWQVLVLERIGARCRKIESEAYFVK
jgi:hypothetical protein